MTVGQAPHDQEGREDRHDRHHDRHDREERAEHERQHQQRAEPAQQRLEQHPGTVAAAALDGQRVVAGQVHRRARDGRAGEGRGRVFRGFGVVAERLVGVGRRVGDDEGRVPVAGEEGGVCRCSRSRPGACRAATLPSRASTAAQFRLARVAEHGPPAGSVTTASSGELLPPGAVEVPRDLLVGDPAFLAGHRELLFQRFRRRARRGHAHEGQHDPEADTMRLCARTQRVSDVMGDSPPLIR